MEEPILFDKNIFPTEEIIFSHIGKTQKLWISFFDYIHQNLPEISEEWRYYKDGKSWLMKVTKKSKTIFWLSIIEDAFRITFYFNDRAEDAISDSTISDELKQKFQNGKRYNKIRGITIIPKYKKDLESIKTLMNIKLSIK